MLSGMAEIIKVGIADWKLCKIPDKITTIGLGSCVGIVLYAEGNACCGLAHIMLPSSQEIKNNTNRAKFADTAIYDLVFALQQQGVRRDSLYAKIAGGAAMFQFTGSSDLGSVGERNVRAVKASLAEYGIPIIAEDTGADYGRTIVFDPATKMLLIRAAGKSEIVI